MCIVYQLIDFSLDGSKISNVENVRCQLQLLDGPDSVLEDDGIYPLAKIVLGSSHSKVKVTYSGMLQ